MCSPFPLGFPAVPHYLNHTSVVVAPPSIQNRLHVTEYLLHLPEFLVLEGHLLRRQRGVRFENPLPVVPRFFLYLLLVDGNGFPIQLQVFPVTLVPHEGFRVGLELLL